jgi:18S rRNA (guanine1575-N7)-methyltransferase
MSRPELTGHASSFYNEKEARKYDSSSRMIGVQREITERAIELLRLDSNNPAFVLDIGCGSGLSGKVLEEHGHVWVGCDISRDMLQVAQERIVASVAEVSEQQQKTQALPGSRNDGRAALIDSNGNESDSSDGDDQIEDEESDEEDDARVSTGDLVCHDMGMGLPFRPATFDACISISALQWLCYSNSKSQNPRQRLTRFFASLYTVLKRGGRAVLQFYPETAEQAVLISETATRVGFTGGVVVDYPNSAKAKKHYLVLSFDRSVAQKRQAIQDANGLLPDSALPAARTSVPVTGTSGGGEFASKRKGKGGPRKHKGIKTKEWIVHKKETQRKQGKNVRMDTKYTARRRPGKF